ncbi:LLM class F420-dependent oxidoreductase [Candidatus Gracilibacteria bacterium]|nr:LLM class F420-dependent oxidoreductase [Candidatus Gracilibacteria bacterium]
MAVQFGVFVPQGWRMDLVEIRDPVEQYEAMTQVAKIADLISAYDSVWVYDHFHTVPKPTLETTFECWTITAALARDTQRVKVGQMVSCLGYRNPAYLAKVASTVDVLSHGRLYCGIGAGWYEHEWRAYGYGFPETRDRMRAFREATQIMVKMWTEERPTFQGEYFTINEPINEPKGVQKPYPSLWIGGGGEQVTLKLVAQYGNACNVGGDPDTLRHKFAVLQGHCETVGRAYDEIIRSSNLNVILLNDGADPLAATEKIRAALGMSFEELSKMAVVGTAETVVARVQGMVDAGVNYVIVYLPRVAYDRDLLHRFAEEVIPHID